MVIFQDSASDMSNWSSAKWNVTTNQYHSPPGSITDSPAGNYGNNTNATISLADGLDLQNSPVAVINFWTKWRTEQGYDYVQFNLSGNNGAWTAQKGLYTKTGFYLEAQGQPLYDGFQPSWVKEQVVTTAFAGNTLKMQFLLKSDPGLSYDGIYFDDVTVTVVDMTKVGTGTASAGQWKLYDPVPNPAAGRATIRFDLASTDKSADNLLKRELLLMDSRGMITGRFPLSEKEKFIVINVEDLAAGLYFYRIIGTFGSTEVKKLIVIH
jgi:hypothetical protein